MATLIYFDCLILLSQLLSLQSSQSLFEAHIHHSSPVPNFLAPANSIAMLSSLLLLTLYSFVVSGQAVSPHKISIESTKPVQHSLHHSNPVPGAIVEYTGEIDKAPPAPVPAQSVYGRVQLILAPYCYKGFPWQRIWVPVDKCYKITENYLMIKKTAVCTDGTYAKLALYDNDECSSMIIITPIHDEMTGSCLQTDIAFRFGLPGGWGKMKSLKVLCKASPEYDKSLALNATINLFTASTKHQEPIRNDSCTGVFNTVSLPPDSCLSGDYYLSNNFLITQQAICANGRLPVMIYYQARGCAGEIRYTSGGAGPSICMWSTVQPRYWSIIWRCEEKPAVWYKVGSESHQVAIPPPAPHPDAPRSAVVVPYLSPKCTWQDGNGPFTLPVGNCLATSGYGIQILETAVCENGTRAQCARFEDDRCGGGTISARYGLVDFADKDQGRCLSMGRPDDSWENIRSMAFWCNELRPADKADAASISSEPYVIPQSKAQAPLK